jgi:hypothetical protein
VNSNAYLVNSITADGWNYAQQMSSGSICLSSAGKLPFNSIVASVTNTYIETGPVADQSFAGGAAPGTPTVYVGGGDYSTLFPTTTSSLSLTLDQNDSVRI